MKKLITLFLVVAFTNTISNAQTTALDFNTADCNGNMHHLFSELDSGNVVIMEFFHTCPSCVSAANDILPMYQDLVSQYGNKVRFFVTPEDDSYPCSSVLNWISINSLTSVIPFDSGSVQTAYYGGSGMPTIAVAAGSSHQLLFLVNSSTASFATSDTGIIGTAVRNFLDTTFAGIKNCNSATIATTIFPNPVNENFTIKIENKNSGSLKLELTTLSGQRIILLSEEKIPSGTWSKNFSASSLSAGIYLIKGRVNDQSFSETITIQR